MQAARNTNHQAMRNSQRSKSYSQLATGNSQKATGFSSLHQQTDQLRSRLAL